MKYLHIIVPSMRVMKGYMMMIKHYFNSKEHTFLTNRATLNNDAGLLLFDNVIDFDSFGHGKLRKYKAFKRYMDDADLIVFHGLNLSNKWILMMWLNQKWFNKCIWFMWGIDLYNYLLPNKGIKNRFLNHINTVVRKAIRYPCATFPSDVDIYHKLICKDKKVYVATTPISDQSFKEMANIINEQYFGKTYRIMVGNNAHSFNRHKDALDLLEKFLDENIKIYMPVNYGEDNFTGKKYVLKLSRYASAIFGDKATCMTKFLPIDKYHAFLASIDVAIFNANRQNAMGNIMKLLYMGKKVYLNKKDNTRYYQLVEQGFIIHDIDELKSTTFDEFVTPDNVSVPNEHVIEQFGEKGAAAAWKAMFDDIIKSQEL